MVNGQRQATNEYAPSPHTPHTPHTPRCQLWIRESVLGHRDLELVKGGEPQATESLRALRTHEVHRHWRRPRGRLRVFLTIFTKNLLYCTVELQYEEDLRME